MKLETFFEKFDTFADAPDAVAKMRELLLGLAISGHLVEQRPSEGFAADLLTIASSERSRLIAEGNLKKQRDIKPVADFECHDLPSSWAWTTLNEITEVAPRNDADASTFASFLPMPAIPQRYGGNLEPETRPWSEIQKGFTHLADGDIALAKITPCFQNGKSAVITGLVNGIGAGTTELHVARPFASVVDPYYVWIFLRSPQFLLEGIPYMTGSAGQKRVPTGYFALKPFPLPPLAEQKRIVAKVDELMALCDRLEAQQQERVTLHADLARGSLARFAEAPTPANLHFLFHKSYPIPPADLRRSILTLAVQGKLVPQDPNDETAIENLDEIESEKAALIEARKLRPNRVTEISQTKDLQYEVPDSWRWFRLGDVAFFQEGPGIRNWQFRTEGIKLLNVQNIVDGKLVLENTDRHISTEEFESTYRHFAVETGDILFASSGASWGKTAWFVDPGYTVMLNTSMVRLKFYSKRCDDAFLLLFLRTEFFKTQMEVQLVGIQPNFGSTHLGRVYIPLPPLAEQRRIVAKVDQLMALVDELETQLAACRATAKNLLDALVAELAEKA